MLDENNVGTVLKVDQTATLAPGRGFLLNSAAVAPTPPNALVHALTYVEKGWHVFPVPPGQKKSHKSAKFSEGRPWGATTDAKEVRRDLEHWPEANVGIVTGPKSGIFVVECDTPEGHDVDGIASLAMVVAKYGALPDTLMAESPSGSLHHYFNYPDGMRITNSASKIAPGIDVRGDGGMVVAPPSVKPGVGTYKWLNETFIADAPDWLLTLCQEKPVKRIQEPELSKTIDPAEIAAALAVIPSDDEPVWFEIGCALAKEFGDVGLSIFTKWSEKSKKYDAGECEQKWAHCKSIDTYTVGTIIHYANEALPGWRAAFNQRKHPIKSGVNEPIDPIGSGVSLDDFHAYMPQHVYIFAPTREPWPASSVNSRLGKIPIVDVDGKPVLDDKEEPKKVSANVWLDQNKPVEQMTWAPGLPTIIKDRLISDGGWIDREKVSCLNLYRPPTANLGSAKAATPWLQHIQNVYGNNMGHIVKWLAHRRQRPQDKINHALVLGGNQGIGKDTLLEPVKCAVGPWNFSEVSPQQMSGRFNGFLRSVILRVNEARDLGDTNRYQFYDHMKTYTAAPPDVLRVDEKHLREHNILNCCGVIITTNYKADGIYLPADDRRHFVAWSDLTKDDFSPGYWKNLWNWYEHGGIEHVAAFLAKLDITGFDPKAPPPKTAAFWDIVDANRAPEDAELADVLDRLQNPDAITINGITNEATGSFRIWIDDRKNRRAIPHRMEKCGYVAVRSSSAKDGLWVINGARQVVYVKSELSVSDRHIAVDDLLKQSMSSNDDGR
jgi:hypothetical protein